MQFIWTISLFICEVIFRLIASDDESEGWNVQEVKRLVDHQDNILSLVSVNGKNCHVMLLGLLVTREVFELWSFYCNQALIWSETL